MIKILIANEDSLPPILMLLHTHSMLKIVNLSKTQYHGLKHTGRAELSATSPETTELDVLLEEILITN